VIGFPAASVGFGGFVTMFPAASVLGGFVTIFPAASVLGKWLCFGGFVTMFPAASVLGGLVTGLPAASVGFPLCPSAATKTKVAISAIKRNLFILYIFDYFSFLKIEVLI
jgi:hypothetical protein